MICSLLFGLLAPAHADTPPRWVQVPRADGLYERWDPSRSWGRTWVPSTLQTVAERVAFELPMADPLMVGDISQRGGGRMDGHRTHDQGIDVDIGLFMPGQLQPLGGFVDLRPHQLDLHANWVLLSALLDTRNVQFILLDQGHIDALRHYLLVEVGIQRAEVDRMFPPRNVRSTWKERGIVRHAPNHSSHLHVRIVPESEVPAE